MKRYWDHISSRAVYGNDIARIRLDRYHFIPNGITKDFTVMEFGDWVNIIPVTPDDRIVMIRQFRHGTKRTTLEIPGGLIDPGETDPADAARRELMEETGYSSDEIEHLGTVEPNPAIQNNRCHTYLAKKAYKKSSQDLDPTEFIEIELIDRKDVYTMIKDGTICHGLVVAAFSHLLLRNT